MEVDNILAAAHELKQPLVDLRQLALAFDDLGDNNEKVREKMISVSDRAIKQINDLIKLKHLQGGLFEMEPVGVRGVCDEVVREVDSLLHFNNRNLYIKYPRRIAPVLANRELLKSIVYNFMLNALHYTSEETQSGLVVKSMRDEVKIEFRDYGPALPSDVWNEMRRGFIEKPKSIAMRPGTSGLGLFIASRFSKYMNAEVGAIRHRDGTSFYVKMPISQQARLF